MVGERPAGASAGLSRHPFLAGKMLQIAREDHPAWKARTPRAHPGEAAYFDEKFKPAFDAFRAQRAELLTVLEPLGGGVGRTATAANTVYEYSILYYGDWVACHQRRDLRHIARILKELAG